MKEISGIPVSGGIAVGKALLCVRDKLSEIPRYSIKKAQVEEEWQRFLTADKFVVNKLEHLLETFGAESAAEQAAIIRAHLMMAEDVDLFEQVRAQLENSLENIEWVVRSVSSDMVQKLMSAPDAYLRGRAVDIADVSRQILNKLLSVKELSIADVDEDVIVVSHDLMPSEILTMNRKHIKALALETGSKTSHTSILARSFNIPAVVAIIDCSKLINSGDILIVNGNTGKVMINPGKGVLEAQNIEIAENEKLNKENLSLSSLPAKTLDGKRLILSANIDLPEEANKMFQFGAEGVGLFRSEFMFLSSKNAADEEKQYKVYSEVLKAAGEFPVKIRTLDIGGDKVYSNFMAEEKNPLLGWRAIRFSLAVPELFKAQLRAILRAAVHGKASIMFPLISCIEEFEQALGFLEEAKEECRKNGTPVAEDIKCGVMIEVPSAVLTADVLAQKADFLSIGTNDLMQYSFAVDRSNEKVNYLAHPSHPAMLRLIKMAVDAAHSAGKPISMCGEMAGDSRYTRFLLGAGLDEFSMNVASIPEVKRIIRSSDSAECAALAERALKCSCRADVNALFKAANGG